MREHPDFIPELDFVAMLDDEVVGNIMYTRSTLVDEVNQQLDTLTFGPVCVHPEHQNRGIGSSLIRHSLQTAAEMEEKLITLKEGFIGSNSDSSSEEPFYLSEEVEIHEEDKYNHMDPSVSAYVQAVSKDVKRRR